jgi:hypothetical protein
LFNPPPNNGASGNSVTTVNVNSSGSSSSSTTINNLAVTQTSFKTPPVAANNKFVSTVNLGKAFQLLSLSASAPCRIQLYGTLTAQSGDSYRGLDVPPPAGSIQNIICDIVLDTSPFQWSFQDRIGANADNPVTSNVYITITNLDITTDVITVSFAYIPFVS